MAIKIKEGDRVRVVRREVTAEDRKANRYFEHMAGLVGEVQSVYGPEEVAVRVDEDTLAHVARSVRDEVVRRMRIKIPEEQKNSLPPERLNFSANYVLLVRADDLEKV
jgi:hypothetical protein